MSIDVTDELAPLVESVATEFGRKFHHLGGGADREDYRQELWAWVYGNLHTVEDRLESTERQDADRYLAKCLRNAAKDYTEDLKAQALGYNRDDLKWYSRGEIRSLLDAMFNPDAWLEPPQSDGRSTKAQSEGNNWICLLADVARAYDQLDLYDRGILKAFHKYDARNKDMAEREGVSEQVMSYHHDRAVKRIHDKLGGDQPRPREYDPSKGRRALSNSQARAATDAGYDDE